MKRVLIPVAVAATLALSACGGASQTVSPPSQAPAAAVSSAPASSQVAAFGGAVTWPSGVKVSVKSDGLVPASASAAGAVEGKIAVFEIAVTNGSKDSINAAAMGLPNVTYGASGSAAQSASDVGQGIGASFLTTILPGETQTVKVGYGIPSAGLSAVRVEVRGASPLTDKPAIFKGAVS